MKLIEIAVLVILLPFFSVNISRNIKLLDETQKNYLQKVAELSMNTMIVSGFKNLCAKNNVQKNDFDEFVGNCKTLFALDFIGIEIIGFKDNKKLLKCTWNYGGKNEESYCQCGGL